MKFNIRDGHLKHLRPSGDVILAVVHVFCATDFVDVF